MTPPDQPPVSTFESSVLELERILRQLEDGSTTLESSLTQYERGVTLLRQCYDQLRSAEQKILLLSGGDAAGGANLQPFEHSSSVAGPKEEKKRVAKPRLKESDGSY
jgi:exodeoxyribonuclease VII small subunit